MYLTNINESYEYCTVIRMMKMYNRITFIYNFISKRIFTIVKNWMTNNIAASVSVPQNREKKKYISWPVQELLRSTHLVKSQIVNKHKALELVFLKRKKSL